MIGKLLAEGRAKSTRKSGAETGAVLQMSRAYIDSIGIEMRLIDSVVASTDMTLFGRQFKTPVMVAPLSFLGKGMIDLAQGAKAAGAVVWAGIGDESELEAMLQTGASVIKIIKPYKDTALIFKKIRAAEELGAFALGMDIDFFFGGKVEDSLVRPEMMSPKTLEEIKSYIRATRLPFILKGVLSVIDAKKAVEAGAGAIVVSHHGGSVLDYAVPPMKILPEIVEAVGGKIPVFVDGGIARGTDVFKAMALGASGVLMGRTVLAGLDVSGAQGVEEMLKGLTEELCRVMSLTGASDIAHIDPTALRF